MAESAELFCEARELFDSENHKIEQTPNDKCPVCSVPDSRKSPNNKEVKNQSRFFLYSAASERKINIIPEPCSERDMPSAPKLGNGF